MNKSAIRLLVLAMFATTVTAVPMVTPAKAATAAKKKQKRTNAAGSEAQTPRTSSSQYPPNMAEDPSRRVSY